MATRTRLVAVISICLGSSSSLPAGQPLARGLADEVPVMGAPESLKAELIGLGDAIIEGEASGSWSTMAEILAPEYRGFAPDLTWGIGDYKREFTKIHPISSGVTAQPQMLWHQGWSFWRRPAI